MRSINNLKKIVYSHKEKLNKSLEQFYYSIIIILEGVESVVKENEKLKQEIETLKKQNNIKG